MNSVSLQKTVNIIFFFAYLIIYMHLGENPFSFGNMGQTRKR